MKLRQEPGDFIVREEADFEPDPEGGFFVYRLHKRGLSTIEVLDQLARKLRVHRHTLSASGLKDKYATTSQLIAAPVEIPAGLKSDHYELEFLGRSRHHLTASAIKKNHFEIVARDLDTEQVAAAKAAQADLDRFGLPNYFDSQRFGGLTVGRGFVAEALVRGDFEGALKRHLAVPYRKEARRPKEAKRAIASRWGDWRGLLRQIPRGPEYFLVEHLARNPGDFQGAFHRIPQHLRVLYLASFQSYFWNLTASALVRDVVSEADQVRISSRMGWLRCYRQLGAAVRSDLEQLAAPRPHPSLAAPAAPGLRGRWIALLQEVLARHDLQLEDFHIREPTRTQFQALDRSFLLRPEALLIDGPMIDRHHPARLALRFRFALPRGSYGTLIVKRLLASAGAEADAVEAPEP
ncbi:MAG: tRNA pseudouridine(13) synthase TruD [Planctomycetota bacterium]